MTCTFRIPAGLLALSLLAGCAARNSSPSPGQALLENEEAWWNRAVFYEVFVRSFADATTGPTAGDGIGDIPGLIEKLDYLNDGDPNTTSDLGVDALWLMPVMPSPSYHGYDITDYYNIEPDYGTREDFLRLVDECHRRGIRLIIDMVFNHTARRHPFFTKAENNDPMYRQWYTWQRERPQDWDSDYGRAWHKGGDSWFYGNFGGGMPDLNYATPEVTTEMQKVTRYWFEEMGVDGFRLDAIKHLFEEPPVIENVPATHDWLRNFKTYYKAINPQVMTVGEVWNGTDVVITYQEDELDLVFQFELADAILEATNKGDSTALRVAQQKVWDGYPNRHYATFLSNHDMDRAMSKIGNDEVKARAASAILLTSPGTPFLYYGEELGVFGKGSHESVRLPFPWNSEAPGMGFTTSRPWKETSRSASGLAADQQLEREDSLHAWYRKLIATRRDLPSLQSGDFQLLACTNPSVYAFQRTWKEETTVVLVNLSPGLATEVHFPLFPLQGILSERLSGRSLQPVMNASTGNWELLSSMVPGEVMILSATPGDTE